MASNKTVVKGIRAEQSFFDKCDLVAKAEGVDRNKLIIRCVEEYLDNFEWFETTTLGDSKPTYIFTKKENENGIPKSGELLFHGDNEPELIIDGKKYKHVVNGYTYVKSPNKHIKESIYEICKKQFEKEKDNVKTER